MTKREREVASKLEGIDRAYAIIHASLNGRRYYKIRSTADHRNLMLITKSETRELECKGWAERIGEIYKLDVDAIKQNWEKWKERKAKRDARAMRKRKRLQQKKENNLLNNNKSNEEF